MPRLRSPATGRVTPIASKARTTYTALCFSFWLSELFCLIVQEPNQEAV